MILSLALLAVIIVLVLMVRFSSHTPAHWHIDPTTVEKTPNPNQFLLRDGEDQSPPIFDMPAADLARAFDKMALSQPNTILLSGSPDDLWATYVQRTKLMAYPDYISVKFLEAGAGKSTLNVYSRSRYGRSDLGVNRTRINAWIGRLQGA